MNLDGDSSKAAVAEAIQRAAASRGWRIKRLGKRTLKATYKKQAESALFTRQC